MTEPGFKPMPCDAKAYTFTQKSGNGPQKKSKFSQRKTEVMEAN